YGDTDGAPVVVHATLHRLADPPGGVRRELEVAAPVELLDGADQPDRPLLDQVDQGHAMAAIMLCDRDDQPQVRLDHASPGGGVACLDATREHALLVLGQEWPTTDFAEVDVERLLGAVARHDVLHSPTMPATG